MLSNVTHQVLIVAIGKRDVCMKVERHLSAIMEDRDILTSEVEDILVSQEAVDVDDVDADKSDSSDEESTPVPNLPKSRKKEKLTNKISPVSKFP